MHNALGVFADIFVGADLMAPVACYCKAETRMTWTKLILILATGVVLAVVLRYVISPEHTISVYRSTYHGGAEGV